MNDLRAVMAAREAANGGDIVRRVARYNIEREPERLAFKFQKMRGSAFAFLRGSAHCFWEDWRAIHRSLADAPYVWTTGDLHLENVGTYRGDNRLVYFDLNDFDEGALAPATWELGRFLTSIYVAGAASPTLRHDEANSLATLFLDAYADALTDGKARWVERSTATGMVKKVLRNVKKRTRRALLDGRTTLRHGRRSLLIDGRRYLPIEQEERERVVELLERFAQTRRVLELMEQAHIRPESHFFRVLDVARRAAGTASLGLRRYVVLVRGLGSPHENWLLDLKEARASAFAPHIRRSGPSWANEAERIIRIQHRMQAISPALLHPVSLGRDHFLLRELQPSVDRVQLQHWNGKLERLRQFVIAVADLAAWAQLRSASRDGSATIDELIDFGRRRDWRRELLSSARVHSKLVDHDWRRFSEATDIELMTHVVRAARRKRLAS